MNHLCLISVFCMKPLYIEHCIYTKTIIHSVFRFHYLTFLYKDLWQTVYIENNLAMQIKSESTIYLKKEKQNKNPRVLLSLFSLFSITANYWLHWQRYKISDCFMRVSKHSCRSMEAAGSRYSSLSTSA